MTKLVDLRDIDTKFYRRLERVVQVHCSGYRGHCALATGAKVWNAFDGLGLAVRDADGLGGFASLHDAARHLIKETRATL